MLVLWSVMMVGSIIIAFFTGNIETMNILIFKRAGVAAAYGLKLIGVMGFWLGMMKIVEDSGLNVFIAKCVKPLTRRLFPNIPPESDAMGSIVLAFGAVLLGLMDANTPLSIKALEDMQKYNPHPDIVSDDQAVFIGVLTSNLCLITPTVIALRIAANSTNPMEIIAPTIVCTTLSTIFNFTMIKVLGKLPMFRVGKYLDPTETQVG